MDLCAWRRGPARGALAMMTTHTRAHTRSTTTTRAAPPVPRVHSTSPYPRPRAARLQASSARPTRCPPPPATAPWRGARAVSGAPAGRRVSTPRFPAASATRHTRVWGGWLPWGMHRPSRLPPPPHCLVCAARMCAPTHSLPPPPPPLLRALLCRPRVPLPLHLPVAQDAASLPARQQGVGVPVRNMAGAGPPPSSRSVPHHTRT